MAELARFAAELVISRVISCVISRVIPHVEIVISQAVIELALVLCAAAISRRGAEGAFTARLG